MARGSTEEVETVAEGTETPAKESKSTRPKLEEGYVSPIEFRNELVKSGRVTDDFRPQVIYSYIRNGGKNNPFPVHDSNGRPAIKLEEGFAWWDAKEARKVEREANAKAKAEKKAEKAAEAPAEAVTEAE